jgi:hypothetical protein
MRFDCRWPLAVGRLNKKWTLNGMLILVTDN